MAQYNNYNIDFYKQARRELHQAIRLPKFIVLIKALVFPLIYLLNAFFNYRNAKIYELTITPQVCYLQRMLNDSYDLIQRRIRIDDAVWHLPFFLYQEEELKPQGLYQESENKPVYLYNDGEAGESPNDFVVLVPSDITFSDAEMRGKIDSFKLFGTTYTIQRI